jgi:hypothetical protein
MTSIISDVELKSQLERTIVDNNIVNKTAAMKKLQFGTYKNLLVLCVAFLLQFTAFGAMGNLQSSLNTEANIGVNSLSIIYAFLIFSSIFLPHPLIAILGLKWTIVISQVPYVLKFNLSSSIPFSISVIFYMLQLIITRKHILCIQVIEDLTFSFCFLYYYL